MDFDRHLNLQASNGLVLERDDLAGFRNPRPDRGQLDRRQRPDHGRRGAGAVNLTAAYDTTIDPGVSILELSFRQRRIDKLRPDQQPVAP